MLDLLKSLFAASPILALFLCVGLGYAIGKIRIGKFELGGIVGTLFAAIIIGQIGVEVDAPIKTMAFAQVHGTHGGLRTVSHELQVS